MLPETPEQRIRRIVKLRQGLTPEQRIAEDARKAARTAPQVEDEESRGATEMVRIRLEAAMEKAEKDSELMRELYVVYVKLSTLPRLYRCCPFEHVAVGDLLYTLPVVPVDSMALAERALSELQEAGIVENAAAGYRLIGDAPPYDAIAEYACDGFALAKTDIAN